jgi:hypothetical protein
MIRHSDDITFSEELVSCDGTDSSIVTNVQCSIPSATLNAAPYNIDWGNSVYAKLSAINIYGESSMSLEGNGGIIITKPDPPTNIIEDIAQRTLNSIGFYWEQGASDGGSIVIDFRIYYDQGIGDYTLI